MVWFDLARQPLKYFGPKPFLTQNYPAIASSKFCEFIIIISFPEVHLSTITSLDLLSGLRSFHTVEGKFGTKSVKCLFHVWSCDLMFRNVFAGDRHVDLENPFHWRKCERMQPAHREEHLSRLLVKLSEFQIYSKCPDFSQVAWAQTYNALLQISCGASFENNNSPVRHFLKKLSKLLENMYLVCIIGIF